MSEFTRVRRSDGTWFNLITPETVEVRDLNVTVVAELPHADYGDPYTVKVDADLNTYEEFRAWSETYAVPTEAREV